MLRKAKLEIIQMESCSQILFGHHLCDLQLSLCMLSEVCPSQIRCNLVEDHSAMVFATIVNQITMPNGLVRNQCRMVSTYGTFCCPLKNHLGPEVQNCALVIALLFGEDTFESHLLPKPSQVFQRRLSSLA